MTNILHTATIEMIVMLLRSDQNEDENEQKLPSSFSREINFEKLLG